MLQTQTVVPELLALLKELMAIEELEQLRLVGGTALALQIGHRNSVDIDMFGKHSIDNYRFTDILSQFKNVTTLGGSKSIKVFNVNNVKVDFVNYPYPWLDHCIAIDSIRMASSKDIAAMKIAAIAQRGSKKDFIDLYFLLQQFTLLEVLDFYQKKISDGNKWVAVRSLTYFEDADKNPMPKMFKEISWESIKLSIIDHVKSI